MENEYWLNKWQTNDIFWHQQQINPDLINYSPQLNLRPGDCILVPLCGKTRDMLWLADQGYHVIGVELSPIACDDFFQELNVTPTITTEGKLVKYTHNNLDILCGDLFDLTQATLPKVHAIFDCRALIALPLDLRKKYVEHLLACTGKKINILLLTVESKHAVNGPPFPIDSSEVNTLYADNFSINRVKHLPSEKIADHLIAKGYSDLIENVYVMQHKT